MHTKCSLLCYSCVWESAGQVHLLSWPTKLNCCVLHVLLGDDHSVVHEESRTCLQVCEGLHDGTGNMERTGVTYHTVSCANGMVINATGRYVYGTCYITSRCVCVCVCLYIYMLHHEYWVKLYEIIQ